jgi:catechol 2,3-dioxygenase-like lactoylglutathione lyase family enzyme
MTATTSRGLSQSKVTTFVATRDPDRARAFYRDTLALRFVSEDPFAIVFDAGGTTLRVSIVRELTPAPYTVLGWEVADIAAAIKDLSAAGVKFERYDGMPQDERGVWTTPDGCHIAWFKDPDGNTLSVTQFVEASA